MGSNVIVIVQARMGSSRLPGKVLKEINGKPMLAWVMDRARRASGVSLVAVATTTDPADDPLEDFCREREYPLYRGSQFDVLDRYYQAARQFKADVVVRLTADCPLMDPALIERTLNAFFEAGVDFAANRLPPPWKRTYPIGLDIEVCRFAALERAWKEAALPYEREHVMPYLYDEPGRFHILVVDHTVDYGHLRWTVDTPQDLEFIRQIAAHFAGCDDFTWLDVLAFVQQNPDLESINAGIRHKTFDEFDARYQEDQHPTQGAE